MVAPILNRFFGGFWAQNDRESTIYLLFEVQQKSLFNYPGLLCVCCWIGNWIVRILVRNVSFGRDFELGRILGCWGLLLLLSGKWIGVGWNLDGWTLGRRLVDCWRLHRRKLKIAAKHKRKNIGKRRKSKLIRIIMNLSIDKTPYF